jgi:hypothetical protein
MTLRHIFGRLRSNYQKNTTYRIPLYLNLREHHGQATPSEAIIRHANSIGYARPDDLVRAWLSGLVVVFLDGFDEMATSGWGFSLERVREHRYSGMTLVRKFIEESRKGTTIFLAGRWTFFDSLDEMYRCLGIKKNFVHLNIIDFDERQISALIRKLGSTESVPDWIPPRPLLVGYLAANNLLPSRGNRDALTPSAGWDRLITMICEREAKQDHRIYPETVRAILERLATFARNTRNGLGRFDIQSIHRVFYEITGTGPDEASHQLLLRLPALRPTVDEDGSRSFVDQDFSDALRGGDVFRFVEKPYGGSADSIPEELFISTMPSRDLTIGVIADKFIEKKITPKQIIAATQRAKVKEGNQILYELTMAALRSQKIPTQEIIILEGIEAELMDIEIVENESSNIIINNSIFDKLLISEESIKYSPCFNSCAFGSVIGVVGPAVIGEKFKECQYGEFTEGTETTDKILASGLEPAIRVTLTILKKLFFQSGSGRQLSALYRGLDNTSRKYVDPVVDILCGENFAYWARGRTGDVLIPNRKRAEAVLKIMRNPKGSGDAVIRKVAGL